MNDFWQQQGLPQEGEQQSNTSAEQPSNNTILKTANEQERETERIHY